MKIIKHNDRDYEDIVFKLSNRYSTENERVEHEVRSILNDVRLSGDQGLHKYSLKFDNHDIFHDGIKVAQKEITAASGCIDAAVIESMKLAADRIRKFHVRQKTQSWQYEEEAGITLGQLVRPLEIVGLYVPGGKAVYPSSVFMNAIPALIAGVERVVMCTPARSGEINPHILAAADLIGIDEIYKVGGAQAIGAMAYGTKSIPKVDKVVGPGNIYVATAKRLIYGIADIDMLAGPSEVLVIADASADPVFVAADLLSQAEHDEDASAICVTTSIDKAEAIYEEVHKQLLELKRHDIAAASIRKNGVILIEKDVDAAVAIANTIAPEHLELMVSNPFEYVEKVKNAGAIFLGAYTPEAIGDFIAGPNHVLPTGGTARFNSPLSVDDFIKKTSLISFSKDAFRKYGHHAMNFSRIEELDGHGNAISVRFESMDKLSG